MSFKKPKKFNPKRLKSKVDPDPVNIGDEFTVEQAIDEHMRGFTRKIDTIRQLLADPEAYSDEDRAEFEGMVKELRKRRILPHELPEGQLPRRRM